MQMDEKNKKCVNSTDILSRHFVGTGSGSNLGTSGHSVMKLSALTTWLLELVIVVDSFLQLLEKKVK